MRTSIHLLLTAAVVAGLVVPAGAFAAANPSGAADPAAATAETTAPAATTAAAPSANNSSVNVSVGQQLSTVIEATSSEVQGEVEDAGFEAEFEGANESERAEAVAERAKELRERANEIREDYREATREYENGEISKSEYARKLAVLNARAKSLLESYRTLREHAANVSAFELVAAGVNQSALRKSIQRLDDVTGAGPTAILQRFTGQTEGELEIETTGGLSIEVESEDGEQSREIRRPRDDDDSITVDQSTALQTARGALSAGNGTWKLMKASVHPDSGYYKFEFTLQSNGSTGEAEVRVDGSTGAIFRLEEEIETPGDKDEPDEKDEKDEDKEGEEHEDEEDADEHEEEIEELAMILAGGTPAPNATVTVQVLADGEPAANATVSLNGEAVGETGADGTIEVTLPSGSAELVATKGGEEAELEFEFEHEDEKQERSGLFAHIETSASYGNGTVTLTVRYNGSGVGNVTVYANDERVGTTDADGTVTFDTNATEELEIELVKGELEAELTYRIQNGSLVLVEGAHEGDGDKKHDEKEDDEDEEDEEDEDEDDEEDEDEDDEDEEGEEEEQDDDDETADSISLTVVEGDPAPGATITVKATADGEPVEGATVSVESDEVGTTGADGTLTVTLPDEDEVRIEAEFEDARDRLEFDFDG